jgi:hypothetical protein
LAENSQLPYLANSATPIDINQSNTLLEKVSPKPIISNVPVIEKPARVKGVGSSGTTGTTGITDLANIATIANTAANIFVSAKGIKDAREMKPNLIAYKAPLEAETISDRSSAMKTASDQNIDKAINTMRLSGERSGIVGMQGVLTSKALEASNQAAAQIQSARTQQEQFNAQSKNQVNQYNAQMEAQRDAANSEIQAKHRQLQSALISQGMGNIMDSTTGGIQSIFSNTLSANELGLKSTNDEINAILSSPTGSVLYSEELEKLRKKKAGYEGTIFGNKIN